MKQAPTHTTDTRNDADRYATLLEWGTRVGLFALIVSFAVNLLEWFPPHVPLDVLPQVWGLPAKAFLEQTRTPTGWGWLALAFKEGDMANLIGIAVLAGCSLPPLLALVPFYWRRKDRTYAVMCAAIAMVLVLAASGVLTGGH